MSRGGDWHLLGEADDPVPGNSDTILTEGQHYTKVAQQLASQVATLRSLADDEQILKGDYAEGLRDKCKDTAHDLERAHGRFETVGSQLTSWSHDVHTAVTRTATHLQDAEAAQATINANPEPGPRPPGAPEPTQSETDAAEQSKTARDRASNELDTVRGQFNATMSAYNTRAEEVAKAIRAASDDDMKDSTWDKVKGWVDDHADFLKLVADIIGWIVTIVAVIALFCTPAGWILLLVAAIAVIGVGIRALLAASGNGSWADFFIDLVGVLTLGTGKIATTIARVGRMATLRRIAPVAADLARQQKITQVMNAFKSAPFFKKPAVWLLRSNPAMRWIAGRAAYTETKLAWLTKELPEISKMETVLAGMDDVAGAMRKEIGQISTEFPGMVTRTYDVASNIATRAGQIGITFDGIDKLLGDSFDGWKPGWKPYGDLKDKTTYSPGGQLF